MFVLPQYRGNFVSNASPTFSGTVEVRFGSVCLRGVLCPAVIDKIRVPACRCRTVRRSGIRSCATRIRASESYTPMGKWRVAVLGYSDFAEMPSCAVSTVGTLSIDYCIFLAVTACCGKCHLYAWTRVSFPLYEIYATGKTTNSVGGRVQVAESNRRLHPEFFSLRKNTYAHEQRPTSVLSVNITKHRQCIIEPLARMHYMKVLRCLAQPSGNTCKHRSLTMPQISIM